MPVWKFFCPSCVKSQERWFPTYQASQQATCDACRTPLEREWASSNFVVTGYNAKNLYSKRS
jgi:hypothetical protein